MAEPRASSLCSPVLMDSSIHGQAGQEPEFVPTSGRGSGGGGSTGEGGALERVVVRVLRLP